MRVLVTGAAGFLGRNLLLHTAKQWDVTALYHTDTTFPAWLKQQALSRVTPHVGDLTQPQALKNIQKEAFDAVIHFAANTDPARSVIDPVDDLNRNILPTLHLLQQIRCKRFVYFSSGAVYDGCKGLVTPKTFVAPNLPYAISKLAAERYVSALRRSEEHVIVRFFGAYGPYEPMRKVYTKLVEAFAIRKENTFTVRGNGKNFIDAMHVSDACEIVKCITEQPIAESIVDVGCGQPLTLTELVEQAARVFNVKNLKVMYEGIVPEYIEFRMDAAPLKKIYGFSPKVTLEQGLRQLETHLSAVVG